MQSIPHILMVRPDFFGIEYEINPWMNLQQPSVQARAIQQWEDLRAILQDAGATISCLAPVAGLPDLVFTANAALIWRNLAILSRFRPRQRRPEEPYYRQWFIEHGFAVYGLTSRAYFEGAGDALFCGDTLFAGYRVRSEIGAHHEIAEVLGCRVVPLELVDPYYYHLDTCFCPIASDAAIYFPDAFDSYGQRALHGLIPNLIPVQLDEAKRFACNAVVLGRTIVTGTGCGELHRQLRERGYLPRETPLGEFSKAGGSAKCLTLRLDGEEPAAWRSAIPRSMPA
jgi:N-dimethylarginine dimethylaminohydrolase